MVHRGTYNMHLDCHGKSRVRNWCGYVFVISDVSKVVGFLTKFSSLSDYYSPQKTSVRRGQQFVVKEPCIELHHAVNKLEQTNGEVDASTYASLLSLCVHANDLCYGKQIHDHLRQSRWRMSSYLESLILQMYVKCGAHKEACSLFEKMLQPNVYSWSHLILLYINLNDVERAWQVFERMQWESKFPQKITFANLLSGNRDTADINRCRQLHVMIMEIGFGNCVKLGTVLLTMYAKCGSLAAAWYVFDSIVDRDIVSWNAIIAAYNHHGCFDDAFHIFLLMLREEIAPTESTFTSIIDVCTSQTFLTLGQKVHTCIITAGFDLDVIVTTALVNMYGKCNSLDDAQIVYSRSKDSDSFLPNTMMEVFSLHGQHESMIHIFMQMQNEGCLGDQSTFEIVFNSCAHQGALQEGKRMHTYTIWLDIQHDIGVGSAVIDMYGRCSDTKKAENVFSRLEIRDVFAWTSMIVAYVQNKQGKKALQLFDQMQKEKLTPDKITFLGILPAYASEAVMADAQLLHAYLCSVGLDCDVEMANALITMYGKCGSLESAQNIFNLMESKDLVSWNALLAAYAQHGTGKEVLKHYHKMEAVGMKPDCVTFTSMFLACSHSGLLEEGCKCLISMVKDHRILLTAQQLNCVIDLLARAGQLNEAEGLLRSLQIEPSCTQWITLLGACKNQLDIECGKRAAMQAFKLGVSNESPYVLLANMYAQVSDSC